MREYGWSMRITKLPAGNSRVAGSASFSFSLASLASSFLEDFLAFFTGKATVNDEVAREISTCCFCSTCSNSVCSSMRGSSARQNVSGRPFLHGLADGAFGLQVKVFQEQTLVLIEEVQRGEQPSLLVVVIVALRPKRFGKRGILPPPGA